MSIVKIICWHVTLLLSGLFYHYSGPVSSSFYFSLPYYVRSMVGFGCSPNARFDVKHPLRRRVLACSHHCLNCTSSKRPFKNHFLLMRLGNVI